MRMRAHSQRLAVDFLDQRRGDWRAVNDEEIAGLHAHRIVYQHFGPASYAWIRHRRLLLPFPAHPGGCLGLFVAMLQEVFASPARAFLIGRGVVKRIGQPISNAEDGADSDSLLDARITDA